MEGWQRKAMRALGVAMIWASQASLFAATAPMPGDGTLNPPGFSAVKFFPNLWAGDRGQKNDPLSFVFNTELYIFSRGFFDDHRDGVQWDLQVPFGVVKGRDNMGERTQSAGLGDVFAFAEYYYTVFRQGRNRFLFANLLLGANFPTGEYDPEDNGTIGHHTWQGTEIVQLGGRWDKFCSTVNLIGFSQSERHHELSRLERETYGTGSKLPDRIFTAFNMTYWPTPKWGAGLAGGLEKSVHNVRTNGAGNYRSLSFGPTFCINFGKNLQWATNVLVDVDTKSTAEGIGCYNFLQVFF